MADDFNTKNAKLLNVEQGEMMFILFEYAQHMFKAMRSVPRGNSQHINVNAIVGALHICNVWLLKTLSAELQAELKTSMTQINESSEYILNLCDNSIPIAHDLLSMLKATTTAEAELAYNRSAGLKPKSKQDLIRMILEEIEKKSNSGIEGQNG